MSVEEQAAADAAAAAEVEAQAQEAAAQAEAEAEATKQKQAEQKPAPPKGYVPVSEVVKERKKSQDLEAKYNEANNKAASLEQKETKRGFLREALGTLGDNFRIEKPEALETIIENLSFNDKTKDVILNLVEAAKKPVGSSRNDPMFGRASKDQNKPAEEGGKHALWHRMQNRMKTKAS